MKIKKKALLFDIANMAYTVADTGEENRHTLHRVRDICEEGNIYRVSRVLGLAYSEILSALSPLITSTKFDPNRDNSSDPHDYLISFRKEGWLKFALTKERQLRIKEAAHEYMVCRVLADWLAITLPEAADVWKFRTDSAMESLKEVVAAILSSSLTASFTRRISPF